MVEKNEYMLTFISNTREQIHITIPRADKTMTDAHVRQCMEDVISSNIVLTAQGRPTQVHGATLVTTELTTVV
jgi:hypothetical protein